MLSLGGESACRHLAFLNSSFEKSNRLRASPKDKLCCVGIVSASDLHLRLLSSLTFEKEGKAG